MNLIIRLSLFLSFLLSIVVSPTVASLNSELKFALGTGAQINCLLDVNEMKEMSEIKSGTL